MAQDYVVIPNQPNTGGSPLNAAIAADDTSGVGTGPFVQQVSLTNLNTTLRMLLQQLSVLGTSQDPTSGRVRVLLDTTMTALTNVTQISGFGPSNSLVTAAHYMPLDIMCDAWANNVRNRIT